MKYKKFPGMKCQNERNVTDVFIKGERYISSNGTECQLIDFYNKHVIKIQICHKSREKKKRNQKQQRKKPFRNFMT